MFEEVNTRVKNKIESFEKKIKDSSRLILQKDKDIQNRIRIWDGFDMIGIGIQGAQGISGPALFGEQEGAFGCQGVQGSQGVPGVSYFTHPDIDDTN